MMMVMVMIMMVMMMVNGGLKWIILRFSCIVCGCSCRG